MDLLKAGESRGFVPVSFCLVSDGGGVGLDWACGGAPCYPYSARRDVCGPRRRGGGRRRIGPVTESALHRRCAGLGGKAYHKVHNLVFECVRRLQLVKSCSASAQAEDGGFAHAAELSVIV